MRLIDAIIIYALIGVAVAVIAPSERAYTSRRRDLLGRIVVAAIWPLFLIGHLLFHASDWDAE